MLYEKYMITEKDLKALGSYQTRYGKIAYWAIVFVPFFFLIMALLNIYDASKIGTSIGIGMQELFKRWIEGIDIGTQYSGIFLAAMERLTTAMLHFGMAVILSFFALTYHKRRKMDERILEALRKVKQS